MKKFTLVLVASVFLGTELFALGTPMGQFSLYRLLVILSFPLSIMFLRRQPNDYKILAANPSSLMLALYLFWWFWALLSFFWVIDLGQWLQTMVLLSIGIASIVIVYIYTDEVEMSQQIFDIIWWMMTFLVLWGLFEILTNQYFFADLSKLDKYGSFASQPWTRIPITTFTNQNDYATLLLAYLPLCINKLQRSKNYLQQLIYLLGIFLAVFLIYRSESRMILLSLALYFLLVFCLQFTWDFKSWKWLAYLGLAMGMIIILLIMLPEVRERLSQLIYLAGDPVNTGDSRRMNLWRNGLIFLAQTFGLGVGAGNIEPWMAKFAVLPVDEFTNIHNWWLEILVAYGVLVFIAYLVIYLLLLGSLFQIRRNERKVIRQTANSFIAFLLVYIFASITSANNMLIEWHWVYFASLIAFIKVHFRVRKLNP